MSASLHVSVYEPDLSPEALGGLRRLLLAERNAVVARRAEHESLIAELRGLTDADSAVERELAETGVTRADETLADIGDALRRLDSGAYGTCESCGLAVPLERLEAIPSARLCVACTGRRVDRPR